MEDSVCICFPDVPSRFRPTWTNNPYIKSLEKRHKSSQRRLLTKLSQGIAEASARWKSCWGNSSLRKDWQGVGTMFKCSPQRFWNSSGRKGSNQAQGCHVLSESTDNCLMQSELCFLLRCVLHNAEFLKGRALSFSLKWEVRTVCIRSGSCPWVRLSKGHVFHGREECFVFYGLGSSQNAVQPAIFMDPVLRWLILHIHEAGWRRPSSLRWNLEWGLCVQKLGNSHRQDGCTHLWMWSWEKKIQFTPFAMRFIGWRVFCILVSTFVLY